MTSSNSKEYWAENQNYIEGVPVIRVEADRNDRRTDRWTEEKDSHKTPTTSAHAPDLAWTLLSSTELFSSVSSDSLHPISNLNVILFRNHCIPHVLN